LAASTLLDSSSFPICSFLTLLLCLSDRFRHSPSNSALDCGGAISEQAEDFPVGVDKLPDQFEVEPISRPVKSDVALPDCFVGICIF
jgi:hypothetical protein